MQRWILVIFALAAAGCGQKPDEVVEEGTKSVNSWKTTLEMVCRQWAEFRVPTLYVKQTLKAAEEVLGKELQDLEKLGRNDEAQKVVRKIHRLRYWIESRQKELGEADAAKRREIWNAIRPDGEGP
jgi:hypothetical protein